MAKVRRGSTRKSVYESYDTGYIKAEVKKIRVNDNLRRSWYTLDVERIVPDSENEFRQKKLNEVISDINNRLKESGSTDVLTLKKTIDDLQDKLSIYRKFRDTARARLKRRPKDDTLKDKFKRYNAMVGRLLDTIREKKIEYNKVKKFTSKSYLRKLQSLELQKKKLETRINNGYTHSPYSFNDVEIARKKYESLNIRFFENKEAMESFFKTYSAKYWDSHSLDEYWRQYKHRDELIATGQYEDYLAQKYRENYLKKLSTLGNIKEFNIIAANLSKLTLNQLKDLFGAKKGNIKSTTSNAMPHIAEVYLAEGVIDTKDKTSKVTEILGRVRQAFIDVGLKFDETLGTDKDYDYYVDLAKRRYKGKAAKQITEEDFAEVLKVTDMLRQETQEGIYASAAPQAYRMLSYQERVKFSSSDIDTYTKRAIVIKAMRKVGVRYNRYGEAYVPFFKKSLVNELIGDLVDED